MSVQGTFISVNNDNHQDEREYAPLDYDLARHFDDIVDALQPLKPQDRKFIVNLLSTACLLKLGEYPRGINL